jgi:membrane-bound lytic murein transglycosylase B
VKIRIASSSFMTQRRTNDGAGAAWTHAAAVQRLQRTTGVPARSKTDDQIFLPQA